MILFTFHGYNFKDVEAPYYCFQGLGKQFLASENHPLNNSFFTCNNKKRVVMMMMIMTIIIISNYIILWK